MFADRPDFAGAVLGLHACLRDGAGGDGALATGFTVERRHLNMGGICHGGVLATFLDVHMAYAAAVATGASGAITPTVSLTVDFLDPARDGDWLEAHGTLLRETGRLAFMQTVVRGPGGPVARASAIYKLDRRLDERAFVVALRAALAA